MKSRIELPWKIVQEAEAALGAAFVQPCAYDVMRRMLEEFKRPGKRERQAASTTIRRMRPSACGQACAGVPTGAANSRR